MRKFISILAAALWIATAVPVVVAQTSQSYTALSGVSLVTSASATVTQVGQSRLPNFSGAGTLNITETGVTGSPSGCSVALAYVQNNATTATSAVATQSFTPSTGVQQFSILPTVASGDNYKATFACSVYPTAGSISISFSPVVTTTLGPAASTFADPCQNPNVAKLSASISVSSATTTQIVALSTGKAIFVCDVTVSAVGTSPSVQFISGTGTNCGTPVTTFTGAMVASATVGIVHLGFGGTVFSTAVSNEVCLVSGATVTTETGILTYVVQ